MEAEINRVDGSRSAEADRDGILVIAPAIPKPDIASGDLRFFAILQILARYYPIDFLALGENLTTPDIARYKASLQGINVRVLKNGPLGVEWALLRRSYSVVIFEFWHCAERIVEIVRRQQPQAKIIVDSVDLHFLREEAGLSVGISEASVVRSNKYREIKTYQQADMILVVTEEDQVQLASQGVITASEILPNIVPTRTRSKGEREPELLFVGGFRHVPNVDGLLWFVRECWPGIRSGIPGAKLTVVGSFPPEPVQQLNSQEGIEVVGFVPETAPYLDRASLSIAPLRFGAGMKGKVTEAMAAGLAVVTTSFGAQGLNATPGQHLLVADGPDTFSGHVMTLLSDPQRREAMGMAGQKHISSMCSVEVAERKLLEIVRSLAGNGTRKDGTRKVGRISTGVRLSYSIIAISRFALSCFRKLRGKLENRGAFLPGVR